MDKGVISTNISTLSIFLISTKKLFIYIRKACVENICILLK